jgi:hypothetical protein
MSQDKEPSELRVLLEALVHVGKDLAEEEKQRGMIGRENTHRAVRDGYEAFRFAVATQERRLELVRFANSKGVTFGLGANAGGPFFASVMRMVVERDGQQLEVPNRSFERYAGVLRYCIDQGIQPKQFDEKIPKTLDPIVKADREKHAAAPRPLVEEAHSEVAAVTQEAPSVPPPLFSIPAPPFLSDRSGEVIVRIKAEAVDGQLRGKEVLQDA